VPAAATIKHSPPGAHRGPNPDPDAWQLAAWRARSSSSRASSPQRLETGSALPQRGGETHPQSERGLGMDILAFGRKPVESTPAAPQCNGRTRPSVRRRDHSRYSRARMFAKVVSNDGPYREPYIGSREPSQPLLVSRIVMDSTLRSPVARTRSVLISGSPPHTL
jgi:hypothetical protein